MAKRGFWHRSMMRALGVKDAGVDMSLQEYVEYVSRGQRSVTGRSVSWEDALKVTTAFRCARVLADGIATVPLKIMKSDGKTNTPAADNPLYDVFMLRANAWQTGLEYRETVGLHWALAGNHFAFKVKNPRGEVVELWPLKPSYVSVQAPKRLGDRPTYLVSRPEGDTRTLTTDEIWHVAAPSWDSYIGLETIKLAREALGLSLATEEHHARLHRNGARPGGLYSVEGTLEQEDYEALKAWIEKSVEGVENAFSTLILDRQAKFTPMSMNGVDSEHLATRRHQIEEVCRAFGVLPIMVGHANEQTTFASSENMFLAHVVHTIRPLHRRIEAAVNDGLLTEGQRARGHYARFYESELLRGASKDRGEYFTKALGSGGSKGWLTQNEVRAEEGRDWIKGGDDLPQPPAPTATSTPQPGAPQ
jgi:HK97 family phage portal protein